MRVSRGISIHTGMAFLRNEFYNMSIYDAYIVCPFGLTCFTHSL